MSFLEDEKICCLPRLIAGPVDVGVEAGKPAVIIRPNYDFGGGVRCSALHPCLNSPHLTSTPSQQQRRRGWSWFWVHGGADAGTGVEVVGTNTHRRAGSQDEGHLTRLYVLFCALRALPLVPLRTTPS
nr:hypothetical protein CFP56_11114 [Quercus suber]